MPIFSGSSWKKLFQADWWVNLWSSLSAVADFESDCGLANICAKSRLNSVLKLINLAVAFFLPTLVFSLRMSASSTEKHAKFRVAWHFYRGKFRALVKRIACAECRSCNFRWNFADLPKVLSVRSSRVRSFKASKFLLLHAFWRKKSRWRFLFRGRQREIIPVSIIRNFSFCGLPSVFRQFMFINFDRFTEGVQKKWFFSAEEERVFAFCSAMVNGFFNFKFRGFDAMGLINRFERVGKFKGWFRPPRFFWFGEFVWFWRRF